MRFATGIRASAIAAIMLAGVTACGDDEDSNGSTLNEEVETGESVVEDGANEVEQQVDEGAEEDGE